MWKNFKQCRVRPSRPMRRNLNLIRGSTEVPKGDFSLTWLDEMISGETESVNLIKMQCLDPASYGQIPISAETEAMMAFVRDAFSEDIAAFFILPKMVPSLLLHRQMVPSLLLLQKEASSLLLHPKMVPSLLLFQKKAPSLLHRKMVPCLWTSLPVDTESVQVHLRAQCLKNAWASRSKVLSWACS